MKLLKKHFNNNDTLIIGQYIFNGCQGFHVRDSDEIFYEFDVPKNIQEEVLSYIDYSQDFDYVSCINNITINKFTLKILETVEELNSELHNFFNHKNINVRIFCAKYCRKEYLKNFFNDSNWIVRALCAERCDITQIKHFFNDNNEHVLQIVAKRCKVEDLVQFYNKDSSRIRAICAKRCPFEDLNIFYDDYSNNVQNVVVERLKKII